QLLHCLTAFRLTWTPASESTSNLCGEDEKLLCSKTPSGEATTQDAKSQRLARHLTEKLRAAAERGSKQEPAAPRGDELRAASRQGIAEYREYSTCCSGI